MLNRESKAEVAYLECKRRPLTQRRDALRRPTHSAVAEQEVVQTESASQVRDMQDEAQRDEIFGRQDSLIAREIERLVRFERALAKITESTYGLSDVSGERIPEGRLEALPDAINTLEEQNGAEGIAR